MGRRGAGGRDTRSAHTGGVDGRLHRKGSLGRLAIRVLAIRLLAVLVVGVLGLAAWQVVSAGYSKSRPNSIGRSGQPESGGDSGTDKAPTRAVGDVLTKASAISSPIARASADAVLTGRTTGVRLLSYGFVQDYQVGKQLYSAPVGKQLIAFSVTPSAGEVASDEATDKIAGHDSSGVASGTPDGAPISSAAPDGPPDAVPDLSIRVGNTERGPLVITDEYLVVAVPANSGTNAGTNAGTVATNVDLVLTDSGVRQSISLITGKHNADCLAISMRTHRAAVVGLSRGVNVKVTEPSGALGMTSGTMTVRTASLSYWAADLTHPDSPRSAFLHVSAIVKLAGDPAGYGAEPGLLWLRLPDGSTVGATNGAADPSKDVDDIFEVPANLSTATLVYAGSEKADKGALTVVTPVTVPISIPVG
ncbi:hypothetical protein ACSMXN_13000 [Jatrophihabitans sp. DSM 45814]